MTDLADIQLVDLTIEPKPRSNYDPVKIWAECRNVGTAPTDAFVARFELDEKESFEVPVDNIPPGETGWAVWPHNPLSDGDHFVHCVLDPYNAVLESAGGKNSKSAYFEVEVYEFPPQDVGGDQYYDEDALVNNLIQEIKSRVHSWQFFARAAVTEFETAALRQVEQFEWDGDADPDFGGMLWAFTSAVMSHVPGVGTALGVIEQGADLLGMLQAKFGDKYLGESGAKKRLSRAVSDLKTAALATLDSSLEGMGDRLRDTLDPKSPDSPITHVEWGSINPSYISALCDWLGVPEPTAEDTQAPILQALQEKFEAVLNDVKDQLVREAGYGG